MYEAFVPKEIFLTKGIGRHKEKLASFEEALRDAKIASCKTVPVTKGLKELRPGQILHCVISRNTSNEYRRLISASVGLAIPKEGQKTHGYISEHHSFGETDKQAGDYAEDLAALMLSTTLGIEFDNNTTWDQKEEIWRMSGKIVRTTNITQSAICVEGMWTTVVAAAVFVK